MKKSMIAKIVLLIMTFALIACAFTSVFAADDNIPSLNPSLNLNNTSTDGNTTGNSIDNSIGNTTDNNTANTIGNTTENGILNSIGNNTNSNSSSYQESDIPYAGAETSALIIAAFVVCGIIGIYTFKKLSDYSNI